MRKRSHDMCHTIYSAYDSLAMDYYLNRLIKLGFCVRVMCVRYETKYAKQKF